MNSKQWIQRQSTDKFVQLKSNFQYRSRSAFKLYEIQKKFKLLKSNQFVLDLGASPGGWSQVAINELKGKGKVISIDLMHMDHLEGATILLGDIQSPEIQQALKLELGSTRKFDVVLSDMAHKFTGAKSVDVPRVHDLVRFALKVAQSDSIGLSQGGWLVAKYLHGEGDQELKNEFKQYFEKTFDFKPKSCRSESTEAYIIGKGFLLE